MYISNTEYRIFDILKIWKYAKLTIDGIQNVSLKSITPLSSTNIHISSSRPTMDAPFVHMYVYNTFACALTKCDCVYVCVSAPSSTCRKFTELKRPATPPKWAMSSCGLGHQRSSASTPPQQRWRSACACVCVCVCPCGILAWCSSMCWRIPEKIFARVQCAAVVVCRRYIPLHAHAVLRGKHKLLHFRRTSATGGAVLQRVQQRDECA